MKGWTGTGVGTRRGIAGTCRDFVAYGRHPSPSSAPNPPTRNFWFIIKCPSLLCCNLLWARETQALTAPGGAGKAGLGLRTAGDRQGEKYQRQRTGRETGLLPKRL